MWYITIIQNGSARRIVAGNRLCLLRSTSGWIQAFVPHEKKNRIEHILGHEHLKTTEAYLHLAQDFFQEAQSPLERLDL
ncbi:MAG: hypothetical protein H6573_30900 [Lewinellaceae bacterium]|nr:hypothetical protein [Phaeodactylibacter sp.]MCB9351869.1 hypothetical protein [Lewinellaceae bacterium]